MSAKRQIAVHPMSDEVKRLKRLYDRFNARDIETVLAAMHEDVMWAKGMEGGHVHGREGVRSYWTRQWAMIDPYVEPIEFSEGPAGEINSRFTRSCATSTATSSRTRWWLTSSWSKPDWSGASTAGQRGERISEIARRRLRT
jgi:ketosteroid isomerase-like protein